jgi:hypothetical protein
VSLEARRSFAAALWDLRESEAFVLLASTESARALVREAPPLDEVPDVVTPWIRARIWATAHRDAPVAPPLSVGALERELAAAKARGLVLGNPADVASFVTSGSLARAFVFAPRGRKTKLRADRVQSALVRANGRWLGERGATIVDAALAVLGPEPLPFKDVLRRAREAVPAASNDGKTVAGALLRAWETSDVELSLAQKPMK